MRNAAEHQIALDAADAARAAAERNNANIVGTAPGPSSTPPRRCAAIYQTGWRRRAALAERGRDGGGERRGRGRGGHAIERAGAYELERSWRRRWQVAPELEVISKGARRRAGGLDTAKRDHDDAWRGRRRAGRRAVRPRRRAGGAPRRRRGRERRTRRIV